MYSKLSFGEVNLWFYGHKIGFTMTHQLSRKTADLFPNNNFHNSYPQSNALFSIFIFKVYYFAPKAGTFSK